MKVHLVAIGGSVMHNLAIALSKGGFELSGSDDEIFEPSLGRLQKHHLLPDKMGWDPARIVPDLDAVILGMHAKKDNPELQRALELGLPVYSFPGYIYEQCKDKLRVAVCGSHGKTTISAMVLHALRLAKIDFDYLVGAQLKGFETMVKLSSTAKYAILEGDEYLSSAIHPEPKFLQYKPDIALISGIAWDHINVFPDFNIYCDQFRKLAYSLSEQAKLIFFGKDEVLKSIVGEKEVKCRIESYSTPEFEISGNQVFYLYKEKTYPLKIFGRHNLENITAAMRICKHLGLGEEDFLNFMSSFEGASSRLMKIAEGKGRIVFQDFAHAPSKVRASTSAVKEFFPDRKLVACLELHTYSSLNKEFIKEYRQSMNSADIPLIYFNPHTLAMKKLAGIDKKYVGACFDHPNIQVFDNSDDLKKALYEIDWSASNLLLMSSGNFNDMDLQHLANFVVL